MAPAWRYVREAIDLLAATTDDLHPAMARIRLLSYVILDGTLIPIDRVVDQKPYDSGKHRRHGVNVQVIADPADRLVWASAALPGSSGQIERDPILPLDISGHASSQWRFAASAAHQLPPRGGRRPIGGDGGDEAGVGGDDTEGAGGDGGAGRNTGRALPAGRGREGGGSAGGAPGAASAARPEPVPR